MKFFLVLDNSENTVQISPFPDMDKPGGCYLDLGLPLLYAQGLAAGIRSGRDPRREIDLAWGNDPYLRLLVREWRPADNPTPLDIDDVMKKRVYALVQGRLLSVSDLGYLAAELKIGLDKVLRLLHLRVQAGEATWVPAVAYNGETWCCSRCGERSIEEWPGLYGMAATCQTCSSLGPLSSLQVLYRDEKPLPARLMAVHRIPQRQFTPAQETAARQVLDFVQEHRHRRALLWAACGAGKTEVCFPAAAWALEKGTKVLFVAPRQDVVLDVAPRMEKEFPDLRVAVLSGTGPQKFVNGDLVLATAHQLLRFYRAFDLIFFDEMDAYPYRGSRMLDWGLKQALAPDGQILFLTATPTAKTIAEAEKTGTLLRLPARHHRRPLPVPEWYPYNPDWDSRRCPPELVELLEAVAQCGPVLVFVPKISWVEIWVAQLQVHFPCRRVAGSYSSDANRHQKIEQLRSGHYDLFVTTTILERGVTIARAQVVVLAADHPVFDERALVQMAGRAGRTTEYPGGRVLFLGRHRNGVIKTAIRRIKDQNSLAKSMGLID